MVCLNGSLNFGCDELWNCKQTVMNVRLAHYLFDLYDHARSKWFGEDIFQVCKIVMHIHFGRIKVYADN